MNQWDLSKLGWAASFSWWMSASASQQISPSVLFVWLTQATCRPRSARKAHEDSCCSCAKFLVASAALNASTSHYEVSKEQRVLSFSFCPQYYEHDLWLRPPPILSENPEVGIRTHSLEPHVSPSLSGLNKRHRIAIGVMPQAETTENLAWEGNVTIHSHRRESGLISSSNAAWLPHWITHHGYSSNEPNYSRENSIRLSDSNSISVILLDFKWEGFSIGVILWSLIQCLSSVDATVSDCGRQVVKMVLGGPDNGWYWSLKYLDFDLKQSKEFCHSPENRPCYDNCVIILWQLCRRNYP